MKISRRDLIVGSAGVAVLSYVGYSFARKRVRLEDLMQHKPVGNITILHTTDLHAHMKPLYFAEPPNLVAPKGLRGQPGYLTGEELLSYYGIKPGTPEAYVYSSKDFISNAKKYGKTGGAGQLAWVIKRIVEERGRDKVLILDGGDTWVTSAIGLLTEGDVVIDWMNYVGYDAMVLHWEFTLGKDKVFEKIKKLKAEAISYNIVDEFEEPVLKPYTVKEVGGAKVGIIGSSFPYIPQAHPRSLSEGLSFGVRISDLRRYVSELRERHKVDLVILLSHDGLPLDMALAKDVSGIDVILTGHTHDVTPKVVKVNNTLIVCSGSHGKVITRLDLDVRGGRLVNYSFKLIPILSEVIPSDKGAEEIVRKHYKPHEKKLSEVIGVAETMLYKRDTAFSTMDRLIGMAIMDHYHGIDLVQSPGFRWGDTILPGDPITVERVMNFMGLTYPNVYITKRKGEQLKVIWEDIADNVFNPNPYYQQGGDFPRIIGAEVVFEAEAPAGNRLRSVKIRGKELDPNKEYLVAVYGAPPPPADVIVKDAQPLPVYDIVINYIKKVKKVYVDPEPNVSFVDRDYKKPAEVYGKMVRR